MIARADTVDSVKALGGGDAGHAVSDGDFAAGAGTAAADTGSFISACSRNSSAADGDVAAGAPFAAADTGSFISACSRNSSAADGDIAAEAVTAADAGSGKSARRSDRCRWL